MAIEHRNSKFYFTYVILLVLRLKLQTNYCLAITKSNVADNINPSCDIRVYYFKLESHNFNTHYNPVSLFSFHWFFFKPRNNKILEKFAKRRTNIQRMRSIDCRINIIDTHNCLMCNSSDIMSLWLFTIVRDPTSFGMEGFLASFEAIPFNSYTLLPSFSEVY